MSTDQEATIPLEVNISDFSTSEQSESPVVNMKVTVENTSNEPLTFLRWSSPLDPRASHMGIFVFKSLRDGTTARSLDIKINKKLPDSGIFSEEDTIHLKAGGKIDHVIEIKAPGVELEKGERYSVQAKGNWMHVLLGDDAELRTEGQDVLRGSFDSKPAEVLIPA